MTRSRAAAICGFAVGEPHELLGGCERVLRVARGRRELPGQAHRLGVRRAAGHQLGEQLLRLGRIAGATRELGEPEASRPCRSAITFPAAASLRHASSSATSAGAGGVRRQHERLLQHRDRRAVIAVGGLQLGAQQVQRQTLILGEVTVLERRADLRDRGAQLAVSDQGARELLHDLDVLRGARPGAPQQLQPAAHVGEATPTQRRRLDEQRGRLLGVARGARPRRR